MSERFDCIVIGAGLSGISCAGYLAKGGKNTLVLESRSEIGGCTIPSDVNGCTMSQVLPVAAKFNYGDANGWIKAAQDFGADIRVLSCAQPRIYLKGAKKPNVVIPRCLTPEAAAKWMIELLDNARPDLMEDGLVEILTPIMREIYEAPLEKLTVEWGETKVKDWITARTDNKAIHFVFNMFLASCFCTFDADYTWNFGATGKAFTQMRIWLGCEGIMTVPLPDPQHGISIPLADAIQKNFGVEIRLNQAVKKVIIEDGKAKGVQIADGNGEMKTIFADDIVVSSRWVSYEGLFDPMPPFLAEPIKAATAPEHIMGSAFAMYILNDSIHLDPAYFMEIDPETGSHILGGAAQSAEQPWNAPEGKQFIWAFRIHKGDDFEKLGVERIGEKMKEDLELLFPGFLGAVEWQTPVASRITPSHYYYNSLPNIRSSDPSVAHLYFAGDSTYPMHGILTDGAAGTGFTIANEILSKS